MSELSRPIYLITVDREGLWYVKDNDGNIMDGPFDTRREATNALREIQRLGAKGLDV